MVSVSRYAVTLCEFEIPVKTGRGLNDREHWATRRRRVSKEKGTTADAYAVYAAERVREYGFGLHAVYQITLTRLSSGRLDGDNLQGALKSIRDEIATQLGFTDDSHEALHWVYGQEKCRRGYYGVKVKIEGIY